MKKSTTKRALWLSVLSMFLCLTMFMGTTFAWFTDEVTSGTNTIVAGNLDVELYHNNKNTTTDEKVDGNTKLFQLSDKQLWEPGAVVYENLTVANEGNLALKYQLSVNVTNATKTADGRTLADVLMVAVVEGGFNGDRAAAEALTGYTNLASFIKSGELQPKDAAATEYPSTTYGIVIWWQPSDEDNYYNMNNGEDALTIDLGVKLFATQLMSEEDSFGNDYDEDSLTSVYDAQGLQAALDAGEKNITLENDITLDQSLVIPASVTTYSLRSAAQPTVINLNGKTINAAYAEGSTTNHVYAFENHGNLVITGNGTINARGIYNYGTITLESGTINAIDGNGGYGIVNYEGAALVMNGGTIATTLEDDNKVDEGGYDATTVRVEKGATFEMNGGVINNICDFTAAISNYGTATINAGKLSSVHSTVANYGTLTVNGGEFACKGVEGKTQHVIWAAAGTTTINGGTFDGKDTYNGFNVDASAGAIVNIYGGNFLPVHSGSLYGEGTITVYGGTFDNDVTDRVAKDYEATQNADGTYTVAMKEGTFEQLISGAQSGDTVVIPEGTYTFPASDLKEGVTLQCTPGTVFEGNSGLNINGATVIGATFDAGTGNTAANGTINGTFKDCVFTGSEALRWCYSEEGDTAVFENCVIKTDFRGVHFDTMDGDVTFINCEINGFNAFGGAGTVTFEGCTFGYDESYYNGLNMYCNTVLKNCEFKYLSNKSNFVDFEAAGMKLVIENCTATLDGEEASILDFVGGTYKSQTTIIIDGAYYATTNDQFKAAVAAGATEIWLADGEYDLSGNQKDGLKIVGIGDNVKMANTTKYASGKSIGAIWQAINLENVTLTNTVYTMADGGNATFTNVYFAAGFREGYGTGVVFNNCVFGSNSEGYALHFQTDAASEGGKITLNGCEFEGGKVHLGGKRAYEFTGCEFAAGTDFQIWSGITLENCTVDGVKVAADNVSTLFPNLNMEKVTLK